MMEFTNTNASFLIYLRWIFPSFSFIFVLFLLHLSLWCTGSTVATTHILKAEEIFLNMTYARPFPFGYERVHDVHLQDGHLFIKYNDAVKIHETVSVDSTDSFAHMSHMFRLGIARLFLDEHESPNDLNNTSRTDAFTAFGEGCDVSNYSDAFAVYNYAYLERNTTVAVRALRRGLRRLHARWNDPNHTSITELDYIGTLYSHVSSSGGSTSAAPLMISFAEVSRHLHDLLALKLLTSASPSEQFEGRLIRASMEPQDYDNWLALVQAQLIGLSQATYYNNQEQQQEEAAEQSNPNRLPGWIGEGAKGTEILRDIFARGSLLFPGDPGINYELGVLHLQLGSLHCAAACMRRSLAGAGFAAAGGGYIRDYLSGGDRSIVAMNLERIERTILTKAERERGQTRQQSEVEVGVSAEVSLDAVGDPSGSGDTQTPSDHLSASLRLKKLTTSADRCSGIDIIQTRAINPASAPTPASATSISNDTASDNVTTHNSVDIDADRRRPAAAVPVIPVDQLHSSSFITAALRRSWDPRTSRVFQRQRSLSETADNGDDDRDTYSSKEHNSDETGDGGNVSDAAGDSNSTSYYISSLDAWSDDFSFGNIRLNLGCSRLYCASPGWVVADAATSPFTHFTVTATDLRSRFDDGAVAVLYSSHMLEHLSHYSETRPTLVEWRR
jgi:hypothetical protein